MEPRCILPSMRIISVPADCTRSQLGSGRNRYRRLVPGGATIRFRNYPKAQNPHYILLLWHNTGRTFLPQGSARQDVRFWAGERGNALTPHDRGGRHKAL